jgi:hypothetical protein
VFDVSPLLLLLLLLLYRIPFLFLLLLLFFARVVFSVAAPKCPDFGTQLDCDKAALPQITPRDQHRKRFCRIISPHPLSLFLSAVTHTLLFVSLVYFIAR